VGDKVFGGTIVAQGSCLMRVEECGDKATLGKIITLVQEAQSSRPEIQEVADRVASYFVPTVAVISFITFLSWIIAFETGRVTHDMMDDHDITSAEFAFYFALAVWVSACPCAFGLATPTAILVASGVAAKHGILIRRGAALQLCSEVRQSCEDVVYFYDLLFSDTSDCLRQNRNTDAGQTAGV
jgi:Cu+-exporting ATPase